MTNVWIPDGFKDTPVDRKGPRERLAESLDAIFAEKIDPQATTSTRSKASCSASARRATWSARTSSIWATRSRSKMLLTLDAGHFHPTEVISDKLSSVLTVSATRCCCTSAAACAGTAITW